MKYHEYKEKLDKCGFYSEISTYKIRCTLKQDRATLSAKVDISISEIVESSPHVAMTTTATMTNSRQMIIVFAHSGILSSESKYYEYLKVKVTQI